MLCNCHSSICSPLDVVGSGLELGRDRGQGQVRLSGSWHSGTIQRCNNLNRRVHSTLSDLLKPGVVILQELTHQTLPVLLLEY